MKDALNIAFFGSSLVSAYWNGAATYYRGILSALAARGHRITFYEPDAYDRQAHRDIPDPDWAKVVVYSSASPTSALAAVSKARDADIIVKASGVGVHDAVLELAVLELKQPGNLVIFWDVDAPATLDRMEQNADDPFRRLVPNYDLILTYGGGPPVIRAYKSFGARHCIPIYNALDPATHHPVAPDQRFAGDLAFLGNRLPDRERRVEEFFLEPAASLPTKNFLIAGNGWHDKPMPRNVRDLGHLYTRDHNAFNVTPTAVLNINRASMARYGFSPPTRVFEAAGAGACLITDAWEGIEMFLQPGREVLVAQTGNEVAQIISDLDPCRAAAIGEAAQRRILREHTYAHRVVEFERAIHLATQSGLRPVETVSP